MRRAKEILINDVLQQTHFTEEYLGLLSLENLAELVDYTFKLRRAPYFQSSFSTMLGEKNE